MQKEEKKLSQTEILKKEKEMKDPVQERLKKLQLIFARKNDEDTVDEYRKRYFERKAGGRILPPV